MNLAFLSGKKTYLTAILTIVFSVIGVLLGYLEPSQAGEYIIAAVMFIFMRLGITKSGANQLTQ